MHSNIMSLQSYLKPDRGEPFNNIYYYYCMHMSCVSSSGGKWAMLWPLSLLLCYPYGLNSGPQACVASACTRGSNGPHVNHFMG